ncbi:MAG: hypothetical protein J2P36_07540 [Ktedonobacteraceae bacterium]|nr:hypothetical protein [Ktedonobacteraceae bacterium]
MARTLSPALSAAINAPTRRPLVTLIAADTINHRQQSVTTSANVDIWFDACLASDGSIIRVKVTNSGGTSFSRSFQFQRITDPTIASQWTTWTTFSGGSNNMFQDGGVAISNNSGTLRAFAQQGTGGNAILCWTSTNNGIIWSGPVTVVSPPGSALTKGLSSAGNNDLFLLYDIPFNNQLGCSLFSGGTWSALHTSSLPPIPFVSQHTGLAVAWNGNSSLYTIIYSTNTALSVALATADATTWVQRPDIVEAANQNILRAAPRLAFFDGLYHLLCIEYDTGVNTGTAYQYPRVRQSVDLVHWSGGFILHDMPSRFGAALLKTTPPGQGRARYVAITQPLIQLGLDYQQSDSAQYIDLSARILEYQRTEESSRPAHLSVILDNSGSQLSASVATYGSTYAPIGLNTTLTLAEGYRTGTPPVTPEVITVAKYRVRRITFERAPGRNQLRLEATDLTSLLDHVNRFQATYSNQTLAWMITEICARAGLFSVSLPGTTQMNDVLATFVLHAGQRLRSALNELCSVGWLEYFLDQDETLQFRELAPTDPVAWSYEPEIETLTIGSDDQRANHIIVSGRPPGGPAAPVGGLTNGEAFDDTHMHVTGLERLITANDPKLLGSAQSARKAAFLLQQEQRGQVAHSISVPANPALQPLDVLSLTDQPQPRGTGLTTTARIRRHHTHYLPHEALFQQTIDLEGP